MKRGTLSFDRPDPDEPDAAGIQAEFDAVSRQLQALGADADLLKVHLEVVAERLAAAEHQLWSEEIQLCLGPMNIRHEPGDPSGRLIVFHELQTARGARAIVLPVAIDPRELPRQEDFVATAQRYL
jgi:hypothetical protein